ncbi:MAG: hypothetical protein H6710_00335 [Myxococcales bacterium]|nr:hypothetical protein [Myxococcales bacterium]MCB9703169.1 hypothetical protein [Myxococcales bacterium]
MVLAWGIGGVLGILGNAVIRLWPLASEPVRRGMMTPGLWAVAILWIAFMAYTEGYRGFHRAFSPRVIARALWLSRNPRPHLVVLAPIFCMGLIHATRKRKIVSWTILLGVVGLVMLVRGLEQPWRGIVDGGVIIGLGLGALSILGFAIRALLGDEPAIPPDVPEPGGA